MVPMSHFLHCVIYSHFAAHTTQTWSSMSIIFMTNCRGPLWIFLFFLFCVWVVCVHNWSHFLSFPCLPLTSKDEITSIHRHSHMIFRSGILEKSLDGDNATLWHCVIYSHFETHTTTQTWSSMSIIFMTICRGPLWIFLFFLLMCKSDFSQPAYRNLSFCYCFCHFHVFHSHPKMKSHQIIGNHP